MKILPLLLSSTLVLSTLPSCLQYTKTRTEAINETKKTNQSVLEVEHFILDNGLNVYLNKNPLQPRFRAEIAVHAGSKFDPKDATGIAHYLEHMLFKGTQDIGTTDFKNEKPLLDKITELYDVRFKEKDEKKRKDLEKQINKLAIAASKYSVPNEIAAIYSKLGGDGLNAYTTPDETVYMVDLPKNRLEQWAMVESNRFENPVFRLFQSELETVYEEKNRSIDNKERVVWEAMSQALFKVHPYGTQTTLGSVEHLKNPSLTKMYEFYKTYYVPNNMAIVISGDIDIPETKELIKKYFSVWKKKEFTRPTFTNEEPIKVHEKIDVNYKGDEKVSIAFRSPKNNDEDIYPMTLIQMLLDNGTAGLINTDLVQAQKVRSAYASSYSQEDYGSFYLAAIPKEGQKMEEAEKLLLDELDKIKKGDFDESLLQGILFSFENDKKSTLESNDGRVQVMKESFLTGKSIDDVFNFVEKLKKITKADIVRVANKYFQDNNSISVFRHDKEQVFPKVEKPALEKVNLNNNVESKFIQQVSAVTPEPIQPKWVDYDKDFKVSSYAPGTVFYYTENPVNDLFNFSISYDFGKKHNKDFCEVMNELNYAGVGELKPEEVKKELFKKGLNVSYGCGDYGFGMHISGIDSQFENGVKLAEDILWNAKLDETHLKDKIKNTLTTRQNNKKDYRTLMSALNSYILRGKDSSFINRLSKTELEKVSVKEYPAMKEQLAKQNFTVYYTGQLPQEVVERTVKKYHFPKEIKVPLLNPRKKPEVKYLDRHNKPVKIYFLDYKGAQAHITSVFGGETVDVNKELMTNVYNEYMGGMDGVMFQEVREARALAYSTYEHYYQGGRLGDQDQISGYIGTQADKTIESVKLFIDLLKNPPESNKYFDKAKNAMDNAYRTDYINFRNVVGYVESWGELGFDTDPRVNQFMKLNNVTQSDLKNFIKENIASKNLTFTIVGDKTKVKLDELKKIGDVEEVKLEELFTD